MPYCEDDYHYSEEARERDLRILWKCDQCGRIRADHPGYNEGGSCLCGGQYLCLGEEYTS